VRRYAFPESPSTRPSHDHAMTTTTLDREPAAPTPGANSSHPGADHEPVAPGDIAIGVVVGRASEYFDFFAYGIASALVFPVVFFPFEKGLPGTLLAFVVFSFAFLARPLGTIGFMWIQRRYGREAKLTIALFLLGTSTAGMAFLPGYATLGAVSIVLLSIFRIAQGVALGGSWDGLPSLLALTAPEKKKGWYAALGQLGAPIGFLLASGLFAFLWSSLSSQDFFDWGWRYVFYVAFAINVVALFARLRLVATEEYVDLLETHQLLPAGVREIVRRERSTVLIGAFAALASYALFHLVTVLPVSWIRLYTDRSISEFLGVQMIGAVLAAVGILISGVIADRIGRRSTLGIFAAFIGVFAVFAPWLLNGDNASQDAFILIGFTVLGLAYGQAAGAVSSNFDPKLRYTGAALTTDLGWLIGAAFAPLVALGLSVRFGVVAIAVYLLSGVVCTLAALSFNRSREMRD
jgi:MFS family permease